ncbi:MAG: alpha amylase C-terminal domain-containing protein, partial [Terrimicrobiaceae bacterium]|nr:alpha amylase C-terminal domain-containing protein [Terrimicrobiaceae bacterium]
IRLRRNLDGRSPSLASARLRVTEAADRVLAFRRYRPGRPHEDLLVVYHFGREAAVRRVRFPQRGEWERLFDSENARYGPGLSGSDGATVRTDPDGLASVGLAPFSVVIFGVRRYEPPPPGDDWSAEDWLAEHMPPPGTEAGPETSVLHDGPASSQWATERGPFVLAGDFTHPRPWARDIPGLEAALVGDHVWQLDLELQNLPGMAFQMVNPRTGQAFGADFSGPPPLDTVAIEDGPPARVRGPLHGSYRVTFNEQTLRLRFELRKRSAWQRVAVAGNFNHWSLLADPMFMTGDGKWRARIEWPGGLPLEFILVADGSLERQWGGGRHTGFPAAGTALPLGGPVRIESSAPGAAWLDFNEETGEYSLTPAP